MVTADELRVLIIGDDRSLETALRRSDLQMQLLGDRASRTTRLMTAGFKASAVAIGALGAGLGLAGGFGIKTAAQLETAETAFTTMMGSAERAQMFLKDLYDFALRTPFTTVGVTQSAQRLMAMGFKAGEVIPMMEKVGDAIAAVGGDTEMLGGVTLALSQIQSKGRVMAQEMNQLAERGIPAYKMLAEKLGVDVAQAMKKVESGTVSASVFMEAFSEGVSKRFGGAMARQAETFTGAMEIFKDAFAFTMGRMMVPAINAITSIMPVITDAMTRVLNTIGPMIGRFFEAIGPLVSNAGRAVGSIFDRLPEIVASLTPIWDAMGATMATAFEEAEASVPATTALFEPLGAILGSLGAILGDLATGALRILGVGFRVTATAVTGVLKAVAPLVAVIGAGLRPIISAVTPLFVNLWEASGRLSEQFMPLTNMIASALSPVLAGLGQAIAGVISFFGQMIEAVMPLVAGIGGGLVAAISGLMPLLGSLFSILGHLLGALGPLASALGSVLTPIIEGVALVLGWLARAIGEVIGWIGDFLNYIWEVYQVGDAIKALIDVVSGILLGFVENFWDAGRDIVLGLAGGIAEMASRAGDAIRNVATVIWSTIKDFFGIASPSRLMHEAGVFIVQGLIDGMLSMKDRFLAGLGNMWDGAKSWGADMAGSVAGGAQNALTGVRGAVGGVGAEARRVFAFAEGAVVNKPTPGIFGEAGPEAIMPLDKLGKLLREARDGAMATMQPQGGPRRFAAPMGAAMPFTTPPTQSLAAARAGPSVVSQSFDIDLTVKLDVKEAKGVDMAALGKAVAKEAVKEVKRELEREAKYGRLGSNGGKD